MLADLTSDDGDVKGEKDSVGGARVLDTGLYKMKITMAYIMTAASEALGLVCHFKGEEGQELRQTFWMTSGKAKGKKNYFLDKNGEKQYLPGFNQANAIAAFTTKKEINQLEPEEKIVSIYDYEAKAELPKKMPVLTEMIGQEIVLGVQRQLVDKTEKGDDDKYYPTGETREQNDVDKIFRASDMKTMTEVRGKAEEANFFKIWDEKFKGKVQDKSTKGVERKTPAKGSAPGASSAPKKTASGLFD